MKKNIYNPIVQRILKAFCFTKLSELYGLIGKTSQNINGMINRGTLIKNFEVELVKRKINLDWIKTGQGDMHESQHNSIFESKPEYFTHNELLLDKTKFILNSNTNYSTMLKDIIEAYYEVVICREELAMKNKRIEELEKKDRSPAIGE
jgi:hypothetical protein